MDMNIRFFHNRFLKNISLPRVMPNGRIVMNEQTIYPTGQGVNIVDELNLDPFSFFPERSFNACSMLSQFDEDTAECCKL